MGTKHAFGIILACAVSFYSCTAVADDFLINPISHVGAITPSSSEKDLIRIYGKDNVRRGEIDVGEGFSVEGTILFPDSKNELTIIWRKEFSTPARITIENSESEWATETGIRIGTSLDELEKINGGKFGLTGFEWDYPGRTVSWDDGKLPSQLQVDLDSDVEIPDNEFRQVLGDKVFDSDNEIIKKMKLRIIRMHIVWGD